MCMGTCGWCVCISKKLLIFSIKLFDNKNLPERSKCNQSIVVHIISNNEILCALQISNIHLFT